MSDILKSSLEDERSSIFWSHRVDIVANSCFMVWHSIHSWDLVTVYSECVIPWSSKKQNIITSSSTKAKYIAETYAAKEGIWLKTFVNETTGKMIGPLTIIGDNQGAIALAKDNKFHARTKHINLHYYCYDFKLLSDSSLYSCSVLGKLSIVYSRLLGSRFNLSSPRVPPVSGIVLEVWEWSSAVNKLSSKYRTSLVTTGLYT